MTKRYWAAIIAGLVLLAMEEASAQQPEREEESKFDPQADELLKKMSDYLSNLSSMQFIADHGTEVVLTSGQKIEFGARSEVRVRRPDRLRSDRVGELAHATFYYDGKTLTVHGEKTNMYASTPAPPTLAAAVDFAREKLELETPAADLVVGDVYRELREDAVAGMYIGKVDVAGVPCHHLAYRGKETDFQLWIEDGPQPLPRKYVITTKDQPAQPEFEVMLSAWEINPELPDELFVFHPPQGAEKIEFLSALRSAKKPRR
jgi:hypothetical protein